MPLATDPSWPPVLVAFVGGIVGLGLVGAVVVIRQARAAAREDARQRARRRGGREP